MEVQLSSTLSQTCCVVRKIILVEIVFHKNFSFVGCSVDESVCEQSSIRLMYQTIVWSKREHFKKFQKCSIPVLAPTAANKNKSSAYCWIWVVVWSLPVCYLHKFWSTKDITLILMEYPDTTVFKKLFKKHCSDRRWSKLEIFCRMAWYVLASEDWETYFIAESCWSKNQQSWC